MVLKTCDGVVFFHGFFVPQFPIEFLSHFSLCLDMTDSIRSWTLIFLRFWDNFTRLVASEQSSQR